MTTRNRRLAAAMGVVCVAGLLAYRLGLLPLTSGTTPSGDQRRPDLGELVRALGAYRPLEARLTGGFAYGAIPAASRSVRNVLELGPDVRIAIARIEKNAASSNSEAEWAALATAYVVSGELEKGLQVLEAAVATPAPNPAWLSDLSAVYLAVAQRSDRPELVPKALAAAERATRLNGKLREAVFNRALALEAIHLADQAESGWKAYRGLDPHSPWSQEALAHLTKIEQERSAASIRWEKVARGVEAELDGPAPALEDVKAMRHLLRPWIETTLLPAWAERELQGNRVDAAKQLRRARSAATLLVKAGGDQMPRDGVKAIDRALKRPDSRQAVIGLARAHLALRTAIRLTDDGNGKGANDEFRSAARYFAAGRSPYIQWAPIYRAIAHYAARQLNDAQAALESVAAASDTRYGYLNGRRKWISGLILLNRNHFMASLAEYREAYRALQSSGEWDAELSVSALLAEVLALLGAPSDAWRYQLNALNRASRFGPLRKKQLLLLKLGSVLCLNSNLPEAALHFQSAVIDASASGNDEQPATRVDAYFIRALIDQKLGDAVGARHDLELAKAQLVRIGDQALRSHEEALILLAESSIFQNASPSSAIASATRAIELFRDSAGEGPMVELYLARGRAYLAARQPQLAEKDFLTAIRHFEDQRELMSDRQYRTSFFQEGWQVFAELARLQVVWQKNDALGLDYAERGRARTLLEAASATPGVQPLTVAEVQRRLPDRTAALFFMTLDDRLLIWAVRKRSISLAERPIGAAALRARIDQMLWVLRHRGTDEARVRRDLQAMFLELVEPVRPFLQEADTIAIVPDGPLHALPFAALVDPGSGRYLVQDFVVTTAPSLSTLVRTTRNSRSRATGSNDRALVIGNPAHKRTPDEAWLPQLPFSQQEAETVAAVYPNALLLSRDLATKRALLDNLGRFDIVHYAGHAVVNDQVPALSRLLLASDGASGDDGTLFVSELAKVRLDDTSLVVLAACSTSSGIVTNGEGIASIARPFLEAGAATVVATLWDVQDQSAASLFQQFHRYVAGGQRPTAALALAQRQSIEHQDPTSRAPSQWAWAVSIGAVAQD
jgi:CHAT domain-containing protein